MANRTSPGPARRPDSDLTAASKLAHARPLFDPEILRRATKDSFVKLNPVTLCEESGDVRGGSGRGAHHAFS